MELEIIMVSELSQTQKLKYHMCSLYMKSRGKKVGMESTSEIITEEKEEKRIKRMGRRCREGNGNWT
jgi:hypothetical protein